jgi:hypothetical protein
MHDVRDRVGDAAHARAPAAPLPHAEPVVAHVRSPRREGDVEIVAEVLEPRVVAVGGGMSRGHEHHPRLRGDRVGLDVIPGERQMADREIPRSAGDRAARVAGFVQIESQPRVPRAEGLQHGLREIAPGGAPESDPEDALAVVV